jgi:hypothetical protein
MTDELTAAIDGRQVLAVRYKEADKVVEPYLVYRTKAGKVILHGWQTAGESEKNLPAWCNLSVDEIEEITPTGEAFNEPAAGFNPAGRMFYEVIRCVGSLASAETVPDT